MLKTLLAAAVLLASFGAVAEAHERDRSHGRPHQPRYQPAKPIIALEQAPIQGVGCYWAGQTEFCSRYCYWQPDGRRYCVERYRQARREHVPMVPVSPYVTRLLK